MMMKIAISTILLCTHFCVLASCSVLPSLPYRTAENIAIQKSDYWLLSQSRSSSTVKSGRNTLHTGDLSRFIGIAATGGGSRAAVFTTAVLQELDALGMLKHVNAISSVSGAGLPSAYYALNGSKMTGSADAWEEMHSLMAMDFRSAWARKVLNPMNLLLTSTTDLDRSDLMADVLDEKLFNGATYQKLRSGYGPAAPMWFANATDTTDGGRRFVFDELTFESELSSDLGKLRIAKAVQTSAAFPGVFNSVTFQQFKQDGRPRERYRHLVDGGASDNLGIDTLLELADAHAREYPSYKFLEEPNSHEPFACLLFVIDAFYPAQSDDALRSRDARTNIMSYGIDLNFTDAFDALLAHRRREQLDKLGFAVSQPLPPKFSTLETSSSKSWYRSSRDVIISKSPVILEYGYPRLQNVAMASGKVILDQSTLRPKLNVKGATNELADTKQSCVVWHIGLSGIRSLMKKGQPEGVDASIHQRWQMDEPPQAFRRNLWEIVTRVKTDFDLVGPKNCSKQLLQQSLRDAAHVAILEDPETLVPVCRWFRNVFPDDKFACDPKSPSSYLVKTLPMTKNDVTGVECIE
jgi:NTE family protein